MLLMHCRLRCTLFGPAIQSVPTSVWCVSVELNNTCPLHAWSVIVGAHVLQHAAIEELGAAPVSSMSALLEM